MTWTKCRALFKGLLGGGRGKGEQQCPGLERALSTGLNSRSETRSGLNTCVTAATRTFPTPGARTVVFNPGCTLGQAEMQLQRRSFPEEAGLSQGGEGAALHGCGICSERSSQCQTLA